MIEPAAPAIDSAAAAALMEPLTDLLVRAGSAILAVNRNAMRVEGKLDGSPVTEADLASDRIIAEGLAQLLPEVPALSEERVQFAKPPYRGSFILVDPLDGTKEFVAGRNEFTVNLALVTNGVPLLGIIGAPALGVLWRGLVGCGAERLRLDQADRGTPEPIHTRPAPRSGEPWTAAVSRSHRDPRSEAFIDSRPGAIRQMIGSAVKFGRVAEGAADIYPRAIRRGSRRLCHAGLYCLGRPCGRERRLLSQGPLKLGPAPGRLFQELRGVGSKGVAVGLEPEQIEAVARDHEKAGISGYGHPARNVGRVVAAELRTIDLRMGDKGGAVALIVEAPDCARLARLEIRQPLDRLRLDKISDRVIPLDCKTRETVDHDALGGRGMYGR